MASQFDEDCSVVADLAKGRMHLMLREPNETFPHPYMVPGSIYSTVLWDWDSFFLGIAVGEGEYAKYFEGSMRSFLLFQESDGFIPYNLAVDPSRNRRSGTANPVKPLIGQGLLIALEKQARRFADQPWAKEAFDVLKRYHGYLAERHLDPRGFLTMFGHRGGGTDNNPTVYGRPPFSTAPLLHNILFLRELQAMEIMAGQLNLPGDHAAYRARRQALAEQINRHMWDPIDGLYYDQDVQSRTPERVTQEVIWTLPLKIRLWTCFLPLITGIVPPDRADRMIETHLLDREHFWSNFGVRSMSKQEPLFLNGYASKPGNPSNWQGPIWGVSNYLIFRALMKHRRRDEAAVLAERTASLLAGDVRRTGTVHEYYNTETGEPICNPDFLNWNLLVLTMRKELQSGQDSLAMQAGNEAAAKRT